MAKYWTAFWKWALGGMGQAARGGFFVGLFIVIFGITPGQAFAHLWHSPPAWLFGPTGRAIEILVGIVVIGASLHFRKGPVAKMADPAAVAGDQIFLEPSSAALLTVDQWFNASDAIEKFAAPNLLAERDRTFSECEKRIQQKFDIEDQIREWENKYPYGPQNAGTEEIERRQRLGEVLRLQGPTLEWARQETREAWEALRQDIVKRLASAKLIAKGFRVPHVGGTPEVEIPAAEWRILDLDNSKSEACRKGSGDAIYTGVVIGNARPLLHGAAMEISGPDLFEQSTGEIGWPLAVIWRVKITNPGSLPADNVKMKLRKAVPRPLDNAWGAQYPYPIARANLTIDGPPCSISPGDDEDFEIARGQRDSAGRMAVVLAPGTGTIIMDQSEMWTLSYDVTAANAAAQSFSLEASIVENKLYLRRIT